MKFERGDIVMDIETRTLYRITSSTLGGGYWSFDEATGNEIVYLTPRCELMLVKSVERQNDTMA